MFLRGVANTFDNVTRVRPVPSVGQVDYKTSGCLDGLVINGNPISGCGKASYDALQIGAQPPLPLRADRRPASTSTRATRARPRARTRRRPPANTFDYNTEFGAEPDRHPAHVQRLARLHAALRGPLGRRLARRRHRERAQRRADQRHHQPARHGHASNGVTVTNVPGGNTRGTLRPDLVPGVDPVPEGRRALAEPGRVRRAAARHVRQPAAQLPARPGVLAGRPDDEQGLPVRVRTRACRSGSRSSTSRTS